MGQEPHAEKRHVAGHDQRASGRGRLNRRADGTERAGAPHEVEQDRHAVRSVRCVVGGHDREPIGHRARNRRVPVENGHAPEVQRTLAAPAEAPRPPARMAAVHIGPLTEGAGGALS